MFPAPPSVPDQGLALIDAYYEARDASIARTAAARDATAQKERAFEDVTEWARGQINYAESLFRKDGAKLRLIGWGPRRAPVTEPETAPGQVGHLVVQHEGKNTVSLSWRDPVDGGEASAYRVQRRKPGAEWFDVGTAVASEITLANQESGVEYEYQVIAVNRMGDG